MSESNTREHREQDLQPEETVRQACEHGEEPVQGEQEEELKAKYLRLAADFQNFRRRAEKERSEIYAFANEKIVLELLDVMDNFERAMEHACNAEEGQLMEGMAMILKQLQDVLAKNHVEAIEALQRPFDPTVHDAVMTERSDAFESGTVTQMIKKGYTLHGKVIRPAMVVVAAECEMSTE